MNLVVCGSRSIKDYSVVREAIDQVPMVSIDTVIQGGANGVDSLAEDYAIANGIEVKTVKPDYEKYSGKRAPIERNKQMLSRDEGLVPGGVLIIWDKESNGTKFMLDEVKDDPFFTFSEAYHTESGFLVNTYMRSIGTSPTVL